MISRRSMLAFIGLAPATTFASPHAVDTLELATQELERGRLVRDGFEYSRCQTGDVYVTITHAGIKPEGMGFGSRCKSPSEAISSWLQCAKDYASAHAGTLYWREKPILECWQTAGNESIWSVYSRLVVTDKPEVFATEDECRNADHRPAPWLSHKVAHRQVESMTPGYAILNADV